MLRLGAETLSAILPAGCKVRKRLAVTMNPVDAGNAHLPDQRVVLFQADRECDGIWRHRLERIAKQLAQSDGTVRNAASRENRSVGLLRLKLGNRSRVIRFQRT